MFAQRFFRSTRRPTVSSCWTQVRFKVEKSITTSMLNSRFSPVFHHGAFEDKERQWRKLDIDPKLFTQVDLDGSSVTHIDPEVFAKLTEEAIMDVQHFFRKNHLIQLRAIMDDPDASANDKFVALQLLKNANISAGRVLPSCQDTGTAQIIGLKGHKVLTDGNEEEYISLGVYNAYRNHNLRYSQLAPQSMLADANTKTNLPAQIDLYSQRGDSYDMMVVAKGGGSANKAKMITMPRQDFQQELKIKEVIMKEVIAIGTAACPPYHLAVVIGGLTAAQTMKAVKLLSCKYLDDVPEYSEEDREMVRDYDLENEILQFSREAGIGAQFGGKYFLHDVRVMRMPNALHAPDARIAVGVSCSADRQILARVGKDGAFLEQLEYDPSQYLPDTHVKSDIEKKGTKAEKIIEIDLNRGMDEVCAELSKYPVTTKLSLTGTMIVARDAAHARLQRNMDAGEPLPDYMIKYPVYYAGPAKTPEGLPSGSFGPTTGGRMDAYVDSFQSQGGSRVMIAKGNRSLEVTKACRKWGGFYLGSIGGVAAQLTSESITDVQVHDMETLGMEAVWKIEVKNFPAFIIVDDKGNDFFATWSGDGPILESEAELSDEEFSEQSTIDKFIDDMGGEVTIYQLADAANIRVDEAVLLARRYSSTSSQTMSAIDVRTMLEDSPHIKSRLLLMLSPVGKSETPVD